MDILDPNTGHMLFRHSELADPETHEVRMATGFVSLLVQLRMTFNRPMRVTGPARTRARNTTIPGAHPQSMHIYDDPPHGLDGLAALDVYVGRAWRTAQFVKLALQLGWSVGLAKQFVHIDRRGLAGLDQGAFGYGNRR